MTARDYPHGRWGTSPDPKPTDAERLEAQAAALDALPKPAPSKAVGETLNVTPFADPRTPEQQATAALWDLDEDRDDHMDDSRWDDSTTSIVNVDNGLREYLASRVELTPGRMAQLLEHMDVAKLHRENDELRKLAADATVRAYEPPDTLTGVVGAAVEGLLAVGKRWWRG